MHAVSMSRLHTSNVGLGVEVCCVKLALALNPSNLYPGVCHTIPLGYLSWRMSVPTPAAAASSAGSCVQRHFSAQARRVCRPHTAVVLADTVR
jgi:hypothetical protein